MVLVIILRKGRALFNESISFWNIKPMLIGSGFFHQHQPGGEESFDPLELGS